MGRKNRLLLRQLKKCGLDSVDSISDDRVKKLLKLVESSYEEYEKSLKLLDRSLEVASVEMREAIEINKKQTKKIMGQSKLASLGEMTSMIAHQWRQPLNVISLTVTDLKFKALTSCNDNSYIVEGLDKIDSYVRHLSDTIDDFMGYFKDEKSMQITSFQEIIESIKGILETSLKDKGIKIEYSFQGGCTFKCYPNELKQVVLNIVKNAEDALVERDIRNPKITVKSWCDQKKRYLEIKDNAGGIDPENLDRIFDLSFSTKGEIGTGIGLYMSKIIVENRCGGKLSVRNCDGGACFRIEINAA